LRLLLPLVAVPEPDARDDVRDRDGPVAAAAREAPRRVLPDVERPVELAPSAGVEASPTASEAMESAVSAIDLADARSCSTSAVSWSTRRCSFASLATRFWSLATIFA